MKHPHADLITEWVKDTSRAVDYRPDENHMWGTWIEQRHPTFNPDWQWRFKPEPKPDVVHKKFVSTTGTRDEDVRFGRYANLKLTFDGETGALKSAEVLK